MSTSQPILSPGPLAKVLRPFRRRSLMITAARAVLWSTLAMLAALVLAMWVDLIWALPEMARWWVTRGGAAAAVVAMLAWLVMFLLRADNDWLARRIDEAKRTGGEILSGWQLSSRPVHPDNATSRGLARLAVERAQSLAASFAPPEVFPVDQVRKAGAALLCSVVAIALVAALIPAIATNQLHRFLSPSADVPPFTGVSIELQLETNPVLYGDDAMVTATTSGGSLERLQLVSRTDDGTENVMPMLPTGDGDSGAGTVRWQSLLTRVTEPLTLHARSGRSRSRYQQLDVQMTPQILPPVVRVTPPSYTGGGTYEGPIPTDGLSGLAGTEVQWRVESNRPLSEGRVRLQYRDGTQQQVLLTPPETADSAEEAEPTATVVGTMQLTRPGRFEVSVVDVDGVESQQTVQGTITILADQRPVVRIVSPRQMSLATPDISLPVSIGAEDDYGITALSLYRSLNGSPARKVDFEVDGKARHEVKSTLPLHRYGLKPGDEIQLFARAEDNDPEGPKGAESPVTTIRIISLQQFQEAMLARRGAESLRAKYQAAQRHLENVAEAIRQLEKAAEQAENDPGSGEKRRRLHEKLNAARRTAAEASEAIEQLSKQAMPIDVDQALSRRLAKTGRDVEKMAEQMKNMTGRDGESQQRLSDPEREKLQQMVQQLSGDRQQLQQQAVEPMQHMQRVLPLVADQQRFTQIARQQRDLQRRLNALQPESDDASQSRRRAAELEHEQQQLRQALHQLLDDIQQHAEALPEDSELEQLKETALEFTAAVRDSDAMAQMAGAQKELSESRFARAETRADSAAEILESFLSQCNSMGNQASGSCKAAFRPSAGGPQLGNSLQQLLQMLGMKPGASGMRPGGAPGMGFGYGAGGGYAQRTPGPENVGMYGSVPGATDAPSRGSGDRSSGGVATNSAGAADSGADNGVDFQQSGSATGQADQAVPPQYRSQVAEYFRKLTEARGE